MDPVNNPKINVGFDLDGEQELNPTIEQIANPLGIRREAPDFTFIVLENTMDRPDMRIYSWSTGRLKSVGSINTILEMHDLMSKSLEIIDPNLFFAPDFPEFLLPTSNPSYQAAPQVVPKVLTWGYVRKEPGTMSGTPFRGTQEVRPRFREYLAIFSDQDKQWVIGDNESSEESYGGLVKLIKIKAQAFDNLVQYNIWSKSNYEVEVLTEWVEQFMDEYRGMFREAGIVNLWFDRRIRDDTLVQMNNGYHVRSVLYYIRTERVSVEALSPITRINIKVSVNDLKQTIARLQGFKIESNLYNKIVQNWVNKSK